MSSVGNASKTVCWEDNGIHQEGVNMFSVDTPENYGLEPCGEANTGTFNMFSFGKDDEDCSSDSESGSDYYSGSDSESESDADTPAKGFGQTSMGSAGSASVKSGNVCDRFGDMLKKLKGPICDKDPRQQCYDENLEDYAPGYNTTLVYDPDAEKKKGGGPMTGMHSGADACVSVGNRAGLQFLTSSVQPVRVAANFAVQPGVPVPEAKFVVPRRVIVDCCNRNLACLPALPPGCEYNTNYLYLKGVTVEKTAVVNVPHAYGICAPHDRLNQIVDPSINRRLMHVGLLGESGCIPSVVDCTPYMVASATALAGLHNPPAHYYRSLKLNIEDTSTKRGHGWIVVRQPTKKDHSDCRKWWNFLGQRSETVRRQPSSFCPFTHPDLSHKNMVQIAPDAWEALNKEFEVDISCKHPLVDKDLTFTLVPLAPHDTFFEDDSCCHDKNIGDCTHDAFASVYDPSAPCMVSAQLCLHVCVSVQRK
jgi:hypothetical protein